MEALFNDDVFYVCPICKGSGVVFDDEIDGSRTCSCQVSDSEPVELMEGHTMNGQFALEDLYNPVAPHSKARSTDPSTSACAARLALPRQGVQRRRILDAIMEEPDGLTYDGAAEATGMLGVSVSTRISELAKGGWIETLSERHTSAGVMAKVWTATSSAKEAID